MSKKHSKDSSAPKAGGYRFLAILFFLLAAGGLFLGLLTSVMPENIRFIFSNGWLFDNGRVANSDKLLSGSLFGTLWGVVLTAIDWFKSPNLANFGLFGDGIVQGSRSWFELIASVALVALALLLVLTVVLSLVFMIVSLVSGKSARKCAMGSGILILLSYGGLFLLNYVATCSLTATYSDRMFDFSTYAVAGLTALFMIIAALAHNKGKGFLNVLNVVLTVGTLFALTFPGSQTAGYIGAAESGFGIYDNAAGKTFLVIAITALLVLVGFNLLCGLGRLNAKRGYLFDIVRYGLQLIAAILVIVALFLDPAMKAGVFGADLIPMIAMVAAPLLAVLFSVILLAVAKKHKKAAAAAAAEEEDVEDLMEDSTLEPSDEEVVDEIIDDEIHRYIKERRPAPAAAPAPAPEPAPAPAPAPAPKEEPKPEPAPAPTPIYQPNIIVQAPPQPEQKPREKTEFERRMEAIAREEASNAPSPYRQQTRESFPASAQAYPPIYAQPTKRKGRAQQMQIEDDHVSPYLAGHYDPFLSKLTSQEVSEFGDLFISNKYGMQHYLPVYVIGGNNEEFFNKVFIYLGRFRNYISAELLEKLNQYVSAIRAQK